MSIQYLKTKTNASFVRPVGYRFPAGLSFGAPGTLSVEYLVIGGAGGGGSVRAGGGGAGGFKTGNTTITTTSSIAITIGAGGNGGVSTSGSNGSISVFSSITSNGWRFRWWRVW
jgi:hypothetical protein